MSAWRRWTVRRRRIAEGGMTAGAVRERESSRTEGRQGVKRSLKRFGQWIGRFGLQVHLGPRFGAFGARAIGADPVEDWERAQREAEELDRERALRPEDEQV